MKLEKENVAVVEKEKKMKVETLGKNNDGKYIVNLGLCAGRHPMPVNRFIFDREIKDVKDLYYMECRAFNEVWNIMWEEYKAGDKSALEHSTTSSDGLCIPKGKVHLNLYATGLTVALVCVINTCRLNGIELTLFHYDTTTGEYYPQDVVE